MTLLKQEGSNFRFLKRVSTSSTSGVSLVVILDTGIPTGEIYKIGRKRSPHYTFVRLIFPTFLLDFSTLLVEFPTVWLMFLPSLVLTFLVDILTNLVVVPKFFG